MAFSPTVAPPLPLEFRGWKDSAPGNTDLGAGQICGWRDGNPWSSITIGGGNPLLIRDFLSFLKLLIYK